MPHSNRLQSAFAKGHPALVTFITAGDGNTAANLDALVAGGADVIELGMPFTDPMADGPAIQAANLRSLAAGTTTCRSPLNFVRGIPMCRWC
jgi:tryptophan synthase alpha chain